ncbi:MAG: monooxygenase [Rhodospirillaceae bacterium]|nr:monooxygenase [Rhodospirillaceae bacterium]MBT5192754.1 monooxygenase [Rhodospirillaceae bacterium]MBT5896959.1 monooxygenase [Rhodospirillaceae bacterium]
MMKNTNTVIIAGAGLGGLTLALCLVRAGFTVKVLEQAAALGEVGAGVQISANGARVLYHLGLAEELNAVGFTPEAGQMRHWQTGETLSSRPLGKESEEKFGFPYFHLHRADFHRVLADALTAAAPGSIYLDSKVTGFDQSEDGVTVTLENGESHAGDVLVGCDGIHSTVRGQLFGPDAPRFTGCVAWRATVPVEALPPDHVRPVASNWIGLGGHFVHYYVRSGELVNCVGIMEQDEWQAESWSNEGAKGEFLKDFAGWHENLQILMRAAESCFRWGLFDRDPMDRWSDGRVTLLGDACHPMLPFMAQGAVMAIEDAYTLAQCLAQNSEQDADPAAALLSYEGLRKERTATVQQMSRDNIQFFHHADIPNLEERMSRHREAHLWLYSFDVTQQDFISRGS